MRRASPDDSPDATDKLARARVVQMATPPVRCIVPEGVFDAFGWCASDRLEWRRPHERWAPATPVDGSAPERMVFVLRRPCEFLPTELARLHATGLGLDDELALAPWGIDAATDGFFEQREAPGDVLWLAADSMNALFWGLHDWAHFHHHGPFEDRAWTELQCDAAALAWLWVNRDVVGIGEAMWERVRGEATALSKTRFEAQSGADGEFEARVLPRLDAGAIRSLPLPPPSSPGDARGRDDRAVERLR